jgi:hypothetical protein
MMPNTSREESIPSLLRTGGRWYLVCKSPAVIDKLPVISRGEPPAAELSRWATPNRLRIFPKNNALMPSLPSYTTGRTISP